MVTLGSGLTGPARPVSVLALLDAAARSDGVAPVGEAGLLAIRNRLPDVRHVWAARGDDVVAYAQVDDAGSAELAVHPVHRRQGIGRRTLEAIRDAAGDDVAVWAHGDLPGARALAASAGMTPTRELWTMGRPLGPGDALGPPPAPRGTALRPFVPGEDEAAWVALNARAFADHPEQGRLTVEDVRARAAEEWFDPSVFWLAHETGYPDRLLASMWVKVLPGQDEGEIYALGVDPGAQGRGLGRWLTAVALAAMADRGLARATLYVEGDNSAARRTYERAGFARTGIDVQYRWVPGA